jgi:hypothetical protein
MNTLTTLVSAEKSKLDHIQSSSMRRMILPFLWLMLAVYAHVHFPGLSPPCQWQQIGGETVLNPGVLQTKTTGTNVLSSDCQAISLEITCSNDET